MLDSDFALLIALPIAPTEWRDTSTYLKGWFPAIEAASSGRCIVVPFASSNVAKFTACPGFAESFVVASGYVVHAYDGSRVGDIVL